MSEFNHEDTGGCAVGLTGKINCWNADSEARFVKAMLDLGKWVEKESGALLGHIKAAITLEDGSGITFNLTDLSNGVEKHGNLEPQEKVTFAFMSAVLDIDEHELKHRMFHAIDDSGIDYELDEHVECHCHDHDHHHHHHHEDGEECHCHDHHHDDDDDDECHEHHHHHHHHHDDDDDDDDECHEHHHHHHHEDGEECHCHDHHHHHDDDDDDDDDDEEECHCPECEARRKAESETDNTEKKGFLNKLRRKK